MRCFDPAYTEMQAARTAGRIVDAVVLHNIHRNVSAPDWFTGTMAVTNSFVHEIDITLWLLGSEMVTEQVSPAPGGVPMMVVMQSD